MTKLYTKEAVYRPLLSITDIETILNVLKPIAIADANVSSLYCRLQVFHLKATNGMNSAHREEKARTTNNSSIASMLLDDYSPPLAKIDPKIARKAAYDKWASGSLLCTPNELALVETYRFENNLMSEEEEAALNKKVMDTFAPNLGE